MSSDSSCDPLRRALLNGLMLMAAGAALPVQAAPLPRSPRPRRSRRSGCGAWPLWNAFVARHISADGRVIDFATADQRSTSEGQSYALFFALVENEPALFERVLGWTRHNLCADRPDLNLPSWWWGQLENGQWGVRDANSAADSDLWIAYVLLEAGRLWRRPGYMRAGEQMLALIRRNEVADLNGLGPMLLPGREGFSFADRWTLNPSYLPLPLLRRIAAVDSAGPWSKIAEATARLLIEGAQHGFVADWLAWTGSAFVTDPVKGGLGSYDAIRCYLWAGMTAVDDSLRAGVLAALSGPLQMLKTQGYLAEKIELASGAGSGRAPLGFSGALLPYLESLQQPDLVQMLQQQLATANLPDAAQLPYYERILLLFGQGWLERRFRFDADGRLLPAWRDPLCPARI